MLLIAAVLVLVVGLSACAGPQTSGVETVSVETEAARPKTPAVRVYDPQTHAYHWERDGERVSGKYE